MWHVDCAMEHGLHGWGWIVLLKAPQTDEDLLTGLGASCRCPSQRSRYLPSAQLGTLASTAMAVPVVKGRGCVRSRTGAPS